MTQPELDGTDIDGHLMHDLARELWPIHRSITGDGVRQTLAAIKKYLPALTVHEVPTGTQVFDWTIPREWVIRGARLEGPNGEIIADLEDSNLHKWVVIPQTVHLRALGFRSQMWNPIGYRDRRRPRSDRA